MTNFKINRNILLLFLITIPHFLLAQDNEPSKFDFNGYITNMQSVMYENANEMWVTDNLIHNRLNLFWYPSEHITGTIQVRNRFMYGDQIRFDEDGTYSNGLDEDGGLFDMTTNLFSEQSFLLNSTIDRLWLSYERGKMNIKIGRQRINWGQCFAWNPNDIFNVYSFFDFDYEERPGSDAIRLQIYPSYTSSIELVTKWNHDKKITVAGLYRFNALNYDFQLLSGVVDEQDWVVGTGWTGNIGGAGFSGEMSYFHPVENFSDTSAVFVASLSGNYTFNNSLMLMLEAMYSKLPEGMDISNFLEFYSGPLNAKNMAFTEYSIMGQVSYPITPLLNSTFSLMYYPKIKGYAVLPSLSYSLGDNLTFSAFIQAFSGKFSDAETEEIARQNFTLGFLRLKVNF